MALALTAIAGASCRWSDRAPSGATEPDGIPPIPGGMRPGRLGNRFAYIPAQCYTATRDGGEHGAVHNPCYACHIHSIAPNFVDDGDLQLAFTLPAGAADNPWRNLFAPPVTRQPRESDAEVLARVRAGNYFDRSGRIALARRLRALPPAWDGEGDRRWDGYLPDAWFHFDGRGFDRGDDGAATGWRAFGYAPFLGTFFPTNGSMDDVLIRLDPALRQDAHGRWDQGIYELNLAVVEALITRADVAIDPVDERTVQTDLDLDGRLDTATQVSFDAPREDRAVMHYLGRARAMQDRGSFPLEPGLFPLGTEFLHSVRYLDLDGAGAVVMAARLKELRYAKKTRWLTPADLARKASAEITEQAESPDGALEYLWQFDRGIFNGQGWLFQGFIEAADGQLRPQSYEETLACAGCHGGIGATTDSVFSFPRKLGAGAPARGWFHFSQHGLRGLPEPRRRDGAPEYSLYLTTNGAGDELRENREVQQRFFDGAGRPRAEAFARLHRDMGELLLPSAARALDLDRAYGAIVREQSFTAGRDAVLAASQHVLRHVPVGEKTGVEKALRGPEEAAAGTTRVGLRSAR